jgi:hypothetical protein
MAGSPEGPSAVRDALAWLARHHADRALRDRAYRFSVALDWQDKAGSVVDTVTLRSSAERDASLDPDTAGEQFVEALETVLLRDLLGGLRYRTLAGLAAVGGARLDRAQRAERLLSVDSDDAALAAYRAYAAARADQVPRWLAAGRLAVRLKAAWAR